MVYDTHRTVWPTALVEFVALAAALATGWGLCEWSRATIAARLLVVLPVGALASLASWGFYRGWIRAALGRPLADLGPGELNWWLAGGVWTATSFTHQLATSFDPTSTAGPNIFLIGGMLATPVAIWMSSTAWARRARQRTTWADCMGHVLAPVQVVQVAVAIYLLVG
jgi:hypothetical protein